MKLSYARPINTFDDLCERASRDRAEMHALRDHIPTALPQLVADTALPTKPGIEARWRSFWINCAVLTAHFGSEPTAEEMQQLCHYLRALYARCCYLQLWQRELHRFLFEHAFRDTRDLESFDAIWGRASYFLHQDDEFIMSLVFRALDDHHAAINTNAGSRAHDAMSAYLHLAAFQHCPPLAGVC